MSQKAPHSTRGRKEEGIAQRTSARNCSGNSTVAIKEATSSGEIPFTENARTALVKERDSSAYKQIMIVYYSVVSELLVLFSWVAIDKYRSPSLSPVFLYLLVQKSSRISIGSMDLW